ncbi:MAG TPA: phosphatidylserine decarboxylase family protein [Candidatus Dormibacteraeota bacterium]|nr:phosphatidylserine decarboxylase family protein [Candidatus Dormibacteraeota bacterium]
MRVPVASEGWPFILPLAAAACIMGWMGWWAAAAVFMVAALACLGFFRDPERTPPTLPGAVVAPADGRVMVVTEAMDPWVGPATRVSIFLSPLDVHVNRAPVGGLVKNVEYAPGRFLAAYQPEASEENERCTVSVEGETARVAVKQIAGVLARRIVCRVRPGDSLRAGQRYGLIRFGSRTDLVVPRSTEIRVRVGDRVRGGESVMGVLR